MDDKGKYKDYYYILGVQPNASSEEIQEAYHNLYEKWGPHVSIGGQDPEMLLRTFKDISEAYEVLMDPNRRGEYDRSTSVIKNKDDLRSIWSRMGGPKKEEAEKLKPAGEFKLNVDVTLREAIKGTTKVVTIQEPRPCAECIGLKPVNRMQCPACRGLGYVSIDRTETLELPAGLYDQMPLRFSDLGKYDLQMKRRNDLVVNVCLVKHQFFQVLGMDLTCTVPVTLYEAILGLEVTVPTVTGKVVMKLQPLTQNGRVYRLRGLGLAGADLLITVDVLLPKQMTADERSLFERLANTAKEPNPRQAIYTQLNILA